MALKLHAGLKWLLIPLGAVAVVLLQMLMNGTAVKVVERFRPAKAVTITAEPDVQALLKESLKRSQAKGKIPVVRFNLQNCGVCERVSRDVFTKGEWKKFAEERLEVTEYLMPTSFTDADTEVVQRMHLLDSLAKTSGADQGFPFIAVLARDGTLLGARAGYHAGGAENYVRWAENLANSDKSTYVLPTPGPEIGGTITNNFANTPVLVPVVAATNSAESVVKPTPTNETVAAAVEVVVKGVSGAGNKRVVLLGIGKRNYPLVIGEKKRVSQENGFTVVECREISDAAVVVHVEGEDEDRKLPLPLP